MTTFPVSVPFEEVSSLWNQTENAKTNLFEETEWIIGMAVGSVYTACLTWIAVSVTIYGIRTSKWKNKNAESGNGFQSRKIYTTALVAVLTSLFHSAVGLLSFNSKYLHKSCTQCFAICELHELATLLALGSVLTFLWLRQRSFYQHPSLREFNKKIFIRSLNWTSVALLTIGVTSVGTYWLSEDNHTHSETYICILKPVEEIEMWPMIVGSLLILLCQGMMLFLLLYPLCKQANTGHGNIRRFILRTTVTAAICVVSNFFTLAMVYVTGQTDNRVVSIATITDVNVFANVSSIVLSFESWKAILTCSRFSEIRRQSSPVASATTGVWFDIWETP